MLEWISNMFYSKCSKLSLKSNLSFITYLVIFKTHTHLHFTLHQVPSNAKPSSYHILILQNENNSKVKLANFIPNLYKMQPKSDRTLSK